MVQYNYDNFLGNLWKWAPGVSMQDSQFLLDRPGMGKSRMEGGIEEEDGTYGGLK